MSKRTARSLLSAICNRRKNSDIRADDKEVTGLIDGLLNEIAEANRAYRTAEECSSEEGITVGLIDAAQTCCRVAYERMERFDQDDSASVREALKDMRADHSARMLITGTDQVSIMELILEEHGELIQKRAYGPLVNGKYTQNVLSVRDAHRLKQLEDFIAAVPVIARGDSEFTKLTEELTTYLMAENKRLTKEVARLSGVPA